MSERERRTAYGLFSENPKPGASAKSSRSFPCRASPRGKWHTRRTLRGEAKDGKHFLMKLTMIRAQVFA
ncbi:MAG: hypothetical protein IT577_18140 [Verrucomicrobiae bacterium]|nr:hypothetical protein [Verrucomicrobiae bacterium]